MRARCLSAVALALAAGPVLAACPGETVLSCQIGRKALEVCLVQGAVTYAFGPAGAPEITLSSPVESVAYTPWNGIGRAIWETVAFENRGVTYEVWTSLDKMVPGAATQAGINVLDGASLVAQLTCTPGTVDGAIDRLYPAKEATGQCWNHATFAWQAAPCP